MENIDIRLRIDDRSFCLRAAALIIENGRLLVAKEKHHMNKKQFVIKIGI